MVKKGKNERIKIHYIYIAWHLTWLYITRFREVIFFDAHLFYLSYKKIKEVASTFMHLFIDCKKVNFSQMCMKCNYEPCINGNQMFETALSDAEYISKFFRQNKL